VRSPGKAIHFLSDPDCTLALIGPHGTEAEALEQELGVPVYARATYETHPEVCDVILGDPRDFAAAYALHHVGEIIENIAGRHPGGRARRMLALVDGCVLEVRRSPRGWKARLRSG